MTVRRSGKWPEGLNNLVLSVEAVDELWFRITQSQHELHVVDDDMTHVVNVLSMVHSLHTRYMRKSLTTRDEISYAHDSFQRLLAVEI